MVNPVYDALLAPHIGSEAVFLYFTDGSTLTYGAFIEDAGRIANALTRCGLKPGDRLVVQAEKSPRFLALYAACIKAGLVFLPLNTAYTLTEMRYFIEDSGAVLVVVDEKNTASIKPVVQITGAQIETLNGDGSGTIADKAETESPDFKIVARARDDIAAMLYTSGTTGRSKGAMLTHENLVSNALTLKDLWRFTADDILLHALPIFHVHGLFTATNIMLAVGGAMIFLPRFDTDSVLASLPRATSMMGVPTFYTRLLDDTRFNAAAVKHFRLFISGSAPLLAETHTAFEVRTGHRILERYGMTETGMNTSNPYDGERRAGTVGLPLPDVEVIITDPETGKIVADGKIGMLEIRGPNVFKGYWQMPEKTAEAIRDNGFFITGDLARRDGDGYVHIVGRDKDLIISGGYNIYPSEIETLLDAEPGVLESAVIGVAHPDFGESPVGIIVAERDAQPNTEAIMESIGESLAKFKHPRRLIIVDELPRNAMGKVQKNVLRDEYKDIFKS